MIYLLHGTDSQKVLQKTQELVAALRLKKPDATYERIDFTELANEPDHISSEIQRLIGGQGLFVSKMIIECSHAVSGNKGSKGNKEGNEKNEAIIDLLPDIAQSENIFIFREGDLTKPILTKFTKYAHKIQEYSLKDEKSTGGTGGSSRAAFNIFSLADALGKRDKKTLWVLYMKARRAHLEEENIHGTLFWQVKSMIIARSAKNADEAGLNPFVFQKSKRYAEGYKEGELEKISEQLVLLYHESRRGGRELGDALEQFVLTL